MSQLELVPPVPDDAGRHQRRRRATLNEILEVALEVMREEGVGGLSLAEVARRMGVKPPSLYKHVDSKLAVYDALFAAGARAHARRVEEVVDGREMNLANFVVAGEEWVRWCMENPTLTQLLYWRPVPGFEPSAEAFAPAVAAMQRVREAIRAVVERGELHPDAASDAGIDLLTCLLTGVVTQQLANEPGTSYEDGRFTRHTRAAFDLYTDHYRPR